MDNSRAMTCLRFGALAVAVALQLFVLRLDWRSDTQSNSRFQSLKVQSGYELLMQTAAGERKETVLSYQASARHNHLVTLQMEKASLLSGAPGPNSGAPQSPGKLFFMPDSVAKQAKAGKPCYTSLRVDYLDKPTAEQSVVLRPPAPDDFKELDRLRMIHLRSSSALVVRVSANSQDGENGPNCRNLLSIDKWQQAIGKDWEIALLAAPNTDLFIKVLADPHQEDGFESGQAELESLELEPLHPDRLTVSPTGDSRVSQVRKRAGSPKMTVTNLRLGGDFFNVELSGMVGLPISQLLGPWRWPALALINLPLLFVCIRSSLGETLKPALIMRPLPEAEKLRIFFSYSWADRVRVMAVHDLLNGAGAECWIDQEGIRAGDDWRLAIDERMRASHLVFVFISKTSVEKQGYWWVEIDMAREIAREQPEGRRYLVPIRLEDCPLPNALRKWDCLDWYKPDGPRRLLRALSLRENSAKEQVGDQH